MRLWWNWHTRWTWVQKFEHLGWKLLCESRQIRGNSYWDNPERSLIEERVET